MADHDHVATVIEEKWLADGALAVCACCCGKIGSTPGAPIGEEDTRSWMTLYDVHKIAEPQLAKLVADHKQRVADQHQGMSTGRATVRRLIEADRPAFEAMCPAALPVVKRGQTAE